MLFFTSIVIVDDDGFVLPDPTISYLVTDDDSMLGESREMRSLEWWGIRPEEFLLVEIGNNRRKVGMCTYMVYVRVHFF